jgi:hypothetical protein
MWNLSLATVITNLLSAIPVFGQDLVELIWKYDFYKICETTFEYSNNIYEYTYEFTNNGNLLKYY